MVNVSSKEEKKSVQEMSSTCQISASNEDYFEELQNLRANELSLIQQKERYASQLNELETKAKEQVEKRKHRLTKLISEVSDLRKKCEDYKAIVNSEYDLE
jgi:DNA anti-recombination protein RmuC